jgi:hypothetical protein
MKYTKEQYLDFLGYVENGRGFIDDNVFFKEHQEIAKHLLQLQIAKKPTNFKITALAYSVEPLCFYKCPTCDLTTIHGADYCNNCGQRIDWSDVK